MSDKRMLIVPAELIRQIDDNRGDLSQAEFINFLIENQLKEEPKKEKTQHYVTKEEFSAFEQDIKKLLRSSLDFFVGYGLELGKKPAKSEFEELSSKLHELENDLSSEGAGKEVKLKWK
jgi:hypothetical protein